MSNKIPDPPENLQKFIGGTEFFGKFASDYMEHLIRLGNLQPHHRMLDVGCGVGRMAIPLASYLTKGSYVGIDIHKDAIDWCQENITKIYPNFNFSCIDVYNKTYNNEGKTKASDYKFSFDDESFDFVFLFSVFNHMLPNDMENYLSEISRVLKNNGRCFITYLLLNEESLENIENGKSFRNLIHKFDGYQAKNETHHENVLGRYEDDIRDLYQKYGLDIMEPIHFGQWAGRERYLEWQDIVIALKK